MYNKICAFTGASGTGKSTLLGELNTLTDIRSLKAIKTIELSGRPYLPSDGDYVSNSSDSVNRRINYGSLVTLTASLLNCTTFDVLFFSRCAIDRLAYMRTLNTGRDLEDITIKEIKEIVIPFTKVFYLPIEFPLKDTNDIVRGNNEEVRIQTDIWVKAILREFNIPHTVVKGTVEERMKIITSNL